MATLFNLNLLLKREIFVFSDAQGKSQDYEARVLIRPPYLHYNINLNSLISKLSLFSINNNYKLSIYSNRRHDESINKNSEFSISLMFHSQAETTFYFEKKIATPVRHCFHMRQALPGGRRFDLSI